jgi:NADH dehydrogenase
MKRVFVLGGGYAGLTAAARMARKLRREAEVVLFDPREAHQALPILPDLVGRGFRPAGLRYSHGRAAERFGFTFRQEGVRGLDPDEGRVEADSGSEAADAVLIATGTQTAYHGLAFAEEHGFALDTTEDGQRIRATLDENPERPAVVCGGSYTGVELATAIRRRDRRRGTDRRVLLIDIAETLCPGLPGGFVEYVTDNVRAMGIEVRTGTSVEEADAGQITLSDGERLNRGLLFWSAGVGTPAFVRDLEAEQTRQGRLHVEPSLRIRERCFVAGDAAAFEDGGRILRMSVQFAISQGRHAADNVVRTLRGEALEPFRPRDPGYLIPMANNRACGIVMGRTLYGRVPILLHYLMCTVRSVGCANRWRVACDAARSLAGGR